jgi:hypothetical protein
MGFNLDDYEPVAARLDRWLKDHPEGRVITDLVHYLQDVAVFKAELWLDGEIIATGWAEEVRGQGNVNRTSHVENCETGAVGRALANAGYAGSDVSKRPSREEMGKVQRMSQGTDKRMPEVRITQPDGVASEKQINYIKSLLKAGGHLRPANLDSITKGEASAMVDALKNGTYAPPVNNDEEPF